MSNDTHLVIGGTGKTGRRVASGCEARGVAVRVGSRATGLRLGRPRDLGAGAARRDAVYVSFYPDLALPGARRGIGAFAELAADSGVERLVLLSGRGEAEAQRPSGAAGRRPRLDDRALRWFAQNFSEGFLLDAVLAGEVALPAGDVPEPFVDVEDVADVAVAALTEDGHAGAALRADRPARADASPTPSRRSPPRPAARSLRRPGRAFAAGCARTACRRTRPRS